MKDFNIKKLEANDELDHINSFYTKNFQSIKNFFYESNLGFETCLKISKLTDEVIKKVYEKFLEEYCIKNTDLIICAVGGYGREHLAPYSDLDLLFVPFKDDSNVSRAIEKILDFLWGSDFKVGHSVRKLDEIIEIAKSDYVIQTSLIDCRSIIGDKKRYSQVIRVIEGFFNSQEPENFISAKINERNKRISHHKTNAFLLEPNIKETVGGLRDLNHLSWFFKRVHKIDKPDELLRNNLISLTEFKKFKKAMDFILTVRCYLHFFSERSNERLTFDLQKKISQQMKYKSRITTLSVERFMKHYYLQVRNIKNLIYSLVFESHKENFKEEKSFIADGTNINNNHIYIKYPQKFSDNPENFLNIFYDSYKAKIPLHPSSYRLIFNKIDDINLNASLSKQGKNRFIDILLSDSHDETLNTMNDLGVLAKIIPEFANIIAQSQFDLYHVFTVDQHILRALALLKKMNSKDHQPKHFAHSKLIVQKIKNHKPLYFSVLLHDIGKGLGGNHQKKGKNIAGKISKYFNLKNSEIKNITWLVENHLLFSKYAFSKDLEDSSVIKSFIQKVDTVEKLSSLYILTIVDIASVNDQSWNDWKSILLRTLHNKGLDELKKPILLKFDVFSEKESKKIITVKKKVFSRLKFFSERDFKSFCAISIPNFWLTQSVDTLVKQIDNFFCGQNSINFFDCAVDFTGIKGHLDVTVVTKDRKNLLLGIIEKFIFHGMEVLEARVFTLKNKLIIDTFKISTSSKLNLNDKDIEHKKEKLFKDIKENLVFDLDLELNSRRVKSDNVILKESTKISIDNKSSKTDTIITVYTNDRPYLLYDILNSLLINDLSISIAKISTFEDFIEDTFHVRNSLDLKVISESKLKKIKDDINNRILERPSFVS